MTTTTKPRRATLTLRSRRAPQAQEPRPDTEAHRGPETETEAPGAAGSAGPAPRTEDEPNKAEKAPKSFTVYGKLWKRAVAAHARGDERANSPHKTRTWLHAIVVGAIRNRERTTGQKHELVSIRAPVGTGDRYAAAAERAGYESVSEWACAVLDAAAGETQRERS